MSTNKNINFNVELNENTDMFRIVRLDTMEVSPFTHYKGIAVLRCNDGRTFIATSSYFGPSPQSVYASQAEMLGETVYEITAHQTKLANTKE